MKRFISIILAAVIAFSFAVTAFAEDVKLKDIDNSSINGRVTTYVGVTESVAFYPVPPEASFDIREAQITVSDESIVSVKPYKNEQYRFGTIEITGLKKGSAVITVRDSSGVSCQIRVTVRSKLIYDIKNFRLFLDYLPYNIFVAVVKIFQSITK